MPKKFDHKDPQITQELLDHCSEYVYGIIDQKVENVEQQREAFKNPIWRIGNIYRCIDKDTQKKSKFRPKPAQCVLIYWIYVLGRRRFSILKARQLGFSTLIAIIGLDYTIFNKDTTFNICSHNEDSAKDLLREKVKFNIENLPRGIRHVLDTANYNQNELVFDDNWKIRSKVKVRSGTSSVLHVSEWGKVAATDPIRSREIRTGTLPTASSSKALVFVESTFEGPPAGDFFDNIQLAKQTTVENASEDSYWYMFFPWFYEKSYRIECKPEWIEERTRQYFDDLTDKLRRAGNPFEFDDDQMYFWQVKSYEYGPEMNREMPSTEEEAMTVPVVGAFYADPLLRLDRNARITDFEWNRQLPVFAVCDVGTDDPFAVWLVQTDGRDIDIIYYHEEKFRDATYFVRMFHELEIPIRRWILPWDAQPKNSNFGWITEFNKAGARDIIRLEKYNNSKSNQIDYMLTAFPRLRFRRGATADGRTALSAYHWEEMTPGQLKPAPKHDWASHAGQAFGYIGEAEKIGAFRVPSTNLDPFAREVPKKKQEFKLRRC